MDALYRRLLEFTGDGVCRHTFKEGRVLLCNQGFLNILELDGAPSDYVGKRLRELFVYHWKEGTVRRLLERKGFRHHLSGRSHISSLGLETAKSPHGLGMESHMPHAGDPHFHHSLCFGDVVVGGFKLHGIHFGFGHEPGRVFHGVLDTVLE